MATALGITEISNAAVGSSAATALALGNDIVWQKAQAVQYLTYVEILSERNYVNSPALPLGLVPTDTMSIQIDWTPEQYTGNSMFGCPYPNDNTDFRLFIFSDKKAAYDRGTQRLDNGAVRLTVGTRCTVEIGNYYIKNLTDGTQQIGSSFSYTSSTSPLGFYGQCKIYGCKIYDNGVLIRDLRPALVNGNPCLHDEVTGNNYFASPGVYLAYEGYTPDPLLNGMILHFDGIDNVGNGDAQHASSSRTWENTANSTTRLYLTRTSTSADNDWSSNGAVFTGSAGQDFYLAEGSQQVDQLSSLGIVGSFTYSVGFIYDPDTTQYGGYIGQRSNDKAFIALECDSSGIKPVFRGVDNYWQVTNSPISGDSITQYLSAGQFNTVMFGWKQPESGTNGYFYVFVNGVQVQATNMSRTFYYSTPQVPMTVGASTLGNVCKGTICDIRLYDRILGSSDVTSLNNVLVQRYAGN